MANFNAERVFQRAVDYLGIRPWLDLCITSAAVEYRKPDPRFFEIALTRWDALPYEVVVVGDSRKEEIAGALETGCLSVLLAAQDLSAQVAHDNDAHNSRVGRVARHHRPVGRALNQSPQPTATTTTTSQRKAAKVRKATQMTSNLVE